ncbi:MAG TPA: CinA family protein [Steroidobacteraceae bacterium]|nr:CinA family protein [Steroidobacteraceae bacterium]
MTGSWNDEEIARLVGRLGDGLLRRGHLLVTAESCTGGWIAKACTDRPGSSGWFLGGAVVYSNDFKVRLLGVLPDTLDREGAVSEAVVREMARGALERLGGDVSVAVSGIAGPDGGTADKPLGTVWFAWARRDAQHVELRVLEQHFPGDRDAVRRAAVACALRGLLEEG